MTGIAERTGGAPISWGVCEAPGWGHGLPPDRGPGPTEVRRLLDRYGLRLIGGFLPVPMHVCTDADLDHARQAIETLAAGGADVVVLAARSADGSYDHKVRLTDEQWPTLLATL